tara:strand:+ start:4412 stop:4882 length:471 start_codon:yes stop_codon:yes gene_type:complete
MQPDRSGDPKRRNVVVMVDDDADDLFLAAEAIDNIAAEIDFRTLTNGAELLDYLNRQGQFTAPGSAPRPDLVLLDLNMPLMDGHTTLNLLRKQDEFRDIPVIIFSTSTAPTDIRKSYLGGANTYIAKPQSFDALCEMMRCLSEYWFDTAERLDATD